MTPNEIALTRAVGQLRAEVHRLRTQIRHEQTPRHVLDIAADRAEAQAWLDRIGPDPDADRHRHELINATSKRRTVA